MLGRKVQLIIRDDTSSPTQAATNYQTLITKDKVDLVFGPFSTLLTAPSAAVANRYGYAFIEPAGGGPPSSTRSCTTSSSRSPRPSCSRRTSSHFLLSLPEVGTAEDRRLPALDDPFASPIADRVREAASRRPA